MDLISNAVDILYGESLWKYILLLVLASVAYWYLVVPPHLPPGPNGLPVLGYLPFMDKHAELTFSRLGEKYGNIFHIYLGSRLFIILNDYDAIREAFVKQADVFSGRPHDISFNVAKVDYQSLVSSDGNYWKQHRHLALNTFRHLQVDNHLNSVEPCLMNEIQYFLAQLRNFNGNPSDVQQLVLKSVANSLLIFIVGHRRSYNDRVFRELGQLLGKFQPASSTVACRIFFPWMTQIPWMRSLTGSAGIRTIASNYNQVIETLIREVQLNFTDGQESSYVHAFIRKQREQRRNNVQEEDLFEDEALMHNVRDFLGAGTETTASTILWAMLYMTRNPNIQKKVQNEIDSVTQRTRKPLYSDCPQTPYTEATLLEIQRISSVMPLNLGHRNTRDTTVFGFHIPKDCFVVSNLWNVHHDRHLWRDPEVFRPERFLASDGRIVKPEYLIPFSLGKRSCMGEALAEKCLYLYFTSLMQDFTLVPPDGEMPSLRSIPGLTLMPKRTTICAVSRLGR